MKKLLLAILLVASFVSAVAQSWQTVSVSDTVFYRVPPIPMAGSSPPFSRIDTSRLRSMWVDSAKALASDSVFYFTRGIRLDTPFTICQDTLAASWLGPHMIRKADGTEYYFGRRGDTITFKTHAGLGEHWIIGRTASGKEFQGTVSSLSVKVVDGVPDSVKTISIQAFIGGVPVSDLYNARCFQLSKTHGWLKTLDIYRFTGPGGASVGFGLAMLAEQHDRLPKAYGSWKAGHTNLAWRYSVGNDFITIRNYGCPIPQAAPRIQCRSVWEAMR
jgi:hypothetical protein